LVRDSPILIITDSNALCRHKPVCHNSMNIDATIFNNTVVLHSRQLVHTFRQRTLILVKALMLQKRVRSRYDIHNFLSYRFKDHVFGSSSRTALHVSVFSCLFAAWFVAAAVVIVICSLHPLSRFVTDSGRLRVSHASLPGSDVNLPKFPPHVRS
jgi:hypothetical protein